MRLSLCIAVYNEEKNIHYPLDSAYDFVDEVIIVDGGSTDKTVEIARSYGKKVKIFLQDNPPMFHLNKQKAIEKATGDWILQLDADEALSEDLKKEVLKLLQLQNSKLKSNQHIAYYIPRKNFFLTRFLMKGGQYPDYTIRLYRKGCARFPCKDVHENVEIITHNLKLKTQKPENWKSKIGYLKNPILHYADPEFSRYLLRWDRYTTIEAEQLSKIRDLRSKIKKIIVGLEYFFWKPSFTFFSMYFRHLGFLDGFPGFIFSLFSSIRFWVIYVKWWKATVKPQLEQRD